jgi:hypothetical protein
VQTTVDIDERLLRQLEQQARREGKSLDAYLNQTLSTVVRASETPGPPAMSNDSIDGLPDDDPFFSALEEIRANGRFPALHREVDFQ